TAGSRRLLLVPSPQPRWLSQWFRRRWQARLHQPAVRFCLSRGLASCHPNRVQLDAYQTFYFSLMVSGQPRKPLARRREAVTHHHRGGDNSVWRSCHGVSNLALPQERSLSALAKLPAAPIAAGSNSERVIRVRCTKRAGRTRPARNKSSANAELVDQVLVARFVGATQIVEKLTALADKLEQPTTRMVVLDVGFEMLGEIVDPLGQNRHLHFRRPGISGLLGVCLNDFGLAAGTYRHRSSFLMLGSAHQAGEVEHALGDDFATIQVGQGQQL